MLLYLLQMASGELEQFGRQSFQRSVFTLRVKLSHLLDIFQGVALDAEATRRETYHKIYDSETPDMIDFQVNLFSYSGDDKPKWGNNKQGASFKMIPNLNDVSLSK